MAAFPCAWLPDARNAFPTVDFIEGLNVVEPDGSDAPVVCEADDRIAWREASGGPRLCCLSEYLSLRGQTFLEAGDIVRLFLEQLEDDVGTLCAVRL